MDMKAGALQALRLTTLMTSLQAVVLNEIRSLDDIHISYRSISKQYISKDTSSSRASRGRKFQKKKEVYSKERICL